VAIVIVLILGIVYVIVTVHIPDILGRILSQTFGTTSGIQELIVLSTPFFLTALAVLIPLRIGLWNVGGEGQFFAGAWMASAFAFIVPRLSGPLLIIGMLVAGALGGMLWIVVPALTKAYLNVNEIITTLMLDLAVIYWVDYWISGPWHYAYSQGGILESKFIPVQAHLPRIPIEGGLDSGILIALAITVFVGVGLKYSVAGYKSRVVGSGRLVAAFTGMPMRRTIVVSFVLGGALAGIGGVLQLIGNSYQLTPGISNNTGYLGIAVAVLAGGTITGVVVMSALLAIIMSAGQVVQLYGISSEDVFILIGLLLVLSSIASMFSHYKLVKRDNNSIDGNNIEDPVSVLGNEIVNTVDIHPNIEWENEPIGTPNAAHNDQ
jgi:simple sugar transport system permease protein